MNTQKLRELAGIAFNAQLVYETFETQSLYMRAMEAYNDLLNEMDAEIILRILDSHAELVAAAKQYAENWLIDERDDHDREICISDEHYNDVQALFKAIAKAGSHE